MSKRRRKAGASPVKPAEATQHEKRRKKKSAKSVTMSGGTPYNPSIAEDATATNHSELHDFGGSAENINAAVPAKVKLPPLMVKSVALSKLMRDFKSLGIAAEFKLCRIGTKVVLQNKADYDLVKSYLKDSKAEFYTHDIPSEKPFKVVLRGLPGIDPKEIENELKQHFKLDTSAVFRMARRDEKTNMHRDCLFLVHFKKGSVTLNALKAIRSLFSIIVRWEPYRGGRRDVTQCQQCLNFGHGTRNCNIKPRCINCAQDHITSDCLVEGAVAFKCANCGGAHQGSFKQCPKREDFKHIRKQASTTNQPGRRKEKGPTFTAADFPELTPHRPRRDSRPHAVPQVSGPSGDFRDSTPTPPRSWRPQATVCDNTSNLFSATELMKIFVDMTNALRQCRSKPEQIQVLGSFIIQYGV